MRPCAKELFLILQESQNGSLLAVKKKFSLPKFGEVAKIRLESHNNGSSGMTGGNNMNKASGEAATAVNYSEDMST